MDDDSDTKPKQTQTGNHRKPYRQPRLVRLGTLTELTALVGTIDAPPDTHGTKTQ
jgi:hypothetical protein